jgi:hypothetical protein
MVCRTFCGLRQKGGYTADMDAREAKVEMEIPNVLEVEMGDPNVSQGDSSIDPAETDDDVVDAGDDDAA